MLYYTQIWKITSYDQQGFYWPVNRSIVDRLWKLIILKSTGESEKIFEINLKIYKRRSAIHSTMSKRWKSWDRIYVHFILTISLNDEPLWRSLRIVIKLCESLYNSWNFYKYFPTGILSVGKMCHLQIRSKINGIWHEKVSR